MSNYIDDFSIPPPNSYVEYVLEAKWMKDAKCRGMNPDFFYPERGESTREAKAVCAECPVERECAEYGIQTIEKFGIWGGTSERDRRRVRRIRKEASRAK